MSLARVLIDGIVKACDNSIGYSYNELIREAKRKNLNIKKDATKTELIGMLKINSIDDDILDTEEFILGVGNKEIVRYSVDTTSSNSINSFLSHHQDILDIVFYNKFQYLIIFSTTIILFDAKEMETRGELTVLQGYRKYRFFRYKGKILVCSKEQESKLETLIGEENVINFNIDLLGKVIFSEKEDVLVNYDGSRLEMYKVSTQKLIFKYETEIESIHILNSDNLIINDWDDQSYLFNINENSYDIYNDVEGLKVLGIYNNKIVTCSNGKDIYIRNGNNIINVVRMDKEIENMAFVSFIPLRNNNILIIDPNLTIMNIGDNYSSRSRRPFLVSESDNVYNNVYILSAQMRKIINKIPIISENIKDIIANLL